MKKHKKVWVTILVIILLLVGWKFYQEVFTKTFCWPYCPGMSDADREEIKQSASSAETRDWTTYKNDEYGFEIKYPARGSWNLKIGYPSDGDFMFTVAPQEERVRMAVDFDYSATHPIFSTYCLLTDIKTDSEWIRQTEESNMYKDVVYFENTATKNGYQCNVEWGALKDDYDRIKQFEKIFNTFKFTN